MSYDPDGWIVNYTWYMPGSYPGMGWGMETCAVYMNEGYYWVTLEVLDNGGLNDTDHVWVDVKDATPGDDSPHIYVENPGGTPGQMYVKGSTVEVRWNATDDNPLPQNPINISYGEPGYGWTYIGWNEENDGLFLWNTSTAGCPKAYWMRLSVYDSIGQTTFNTSEYHFYMNCPTGDNPPYITVNQPGGWPGQVYERGDTVEVLWTAGDDNPLPTGPINITYGGPTTGWTTVATNEDNDGHYLWDTSNVPCPDMYYMRLSVYDTGGHTTYDMSEYYFYMDCVVDNPPGAPELLSAVLTGTSNEDVTLTWALSGDDGAGENDVTAYEVYYGTDYASDGSGYVLLATLPAGTTAYVHSGAGDGDLSNYFYYVRAVDAIGQTGSEGQAGKYVRALQGGMKELVSIPLVQEDTQILEVLKTIEGSYDIVRYYKSSDQSDHWKSFKPEKPDASNDFYYIDHKIGFWIKMWDDDHLVVAGLVPETTTLTLEPSWNLIGYACFTPKTVADALSGISYTKVQGWSDKPPQHQKNLNDSDIMADGNAFWIRVHSTQTLVLTN
jgi:hypothetical protein